MTIKLLSITLFIVSASIITTSFASCPSQLKPDNMHECIMMEGNDDLSYREWAPGFYKTSNPEKAAAILAAYEAEVKHNKNSGEGNTLSLSQ
ncbi:hypothetical protein MNBD_GAMMA22-2539 [hydrothermal vent metagenome]|uniref:Uncharacterized protein n=1 Tax=hydrothermal vent metagenome TaxID=652676 RepID=A0A3B0ZV46_9ZZZZ